MNEMQQASVSQESRQKMNDVLTRMNEERLNGGGMSGGELHDDVEEEGIDSDDELDLSTVDLDSLTMDDLSESQRAAFLKAVHDGTLSAHIQPWRPWWESRDTRYTDTLVVDERPWMRLLPPLLPSVTPLIEVVHDEEVKGKGEDNEEEEQAKGDDVEEEEEEEEGAGTRSAPPPILPQDTLIPLSQRLRNKNPSPLVVFGVASALCSYAFGISLYNGDDSADPLHLAALLLRLSHSLSHNAGPKGSSSLEALEAPLDSIVRVVEYHETSAVEAVPDSPPVFRLMAVRHTVVLLQDKEKCLRALSHIHHILDEGKRSCRKDSLRFENKNDVVHSVCGDHRALRKDIKLAAKKIEFYLSWVASAEHSSEPRRTAARDLRNLWVSRMEDIHHDGRASTVNHRPSGAASEIILP